MGGPAANLTAVMSGQVDVGWAAPPFGLDQLDKGDIRRIATGNDAAVFKGQTVRLNIANANYLASKKDVVNRYMKAYRETVAMMYKDRRPEDLRGLAADHRCEGEAHARRLLRAARDRAGHHHRARYHREGRRRAEVHRAAADEGAVGGADPDSAESSSAVFLPPARGRVREGVSALHEVDSHPARSARRPPLSGGGNKLSASSPPSRPSPAPPPDR